MAPTPKQPSDSRASSHARPPTRPDWVGQMRGIGIPQVARHLGFLVGESPSSFTVAPCPACGVDRRHPNRRDRRGAIGVRRSAPYGFRCFACHESGDALHFVSLATVRRKFGGLSSAGVREVREVCLRILGEPLESLPRREVAAAPRYPGTGEVHRLWGEASSVTSDAEARAYLKDRHLDADHIAELDLARVVPRDARWQPTWAQMPGGRSWSASGYRLLLPLVDATGTMRSILARSLHSDRGPKSLAASGFERRGLVLACPQARAMLGGGVPGRLVVAEGELDLLTAATEPAADWSSLGVLTGSWSPELSSRIPRGSVVVIATDLDPAGERFAAQICEGLGVRARAGELRVERWRGGR
ncbi:MAG: toprim domain-containing protein [Sandaracinaceae bacterium]|nr:toprim domain-containing protein [Sandaracinaceae bacterium]